MSGVKCINRRIIYFCAVLLSLCLLAGCGTSTALTDAYDIGNPILRLSGEDDAGEVVKTFAADLCVTAQDVSVDDVDMSLAEGAGLFSVGERQVRYAKNIHERLYPASLTKVLTALVVLEQGNLQDVVTVSENAVTLESGAQKCGLKAGDQIVMSDLLHGMLMYSGNDAARAAAEHISGSEEEFANLMNETARQLGATKSHFKNASGLHDDDHYSTVYDLYLIFQKVIQNETFQEILRTPEFAAVVTGADGESREITWKNTNHYISGETKAPEGVTVLGGKTGTTEMAQSCLILYAQDSDQNPYISVILKARDRGVLYEEMSQLLSIILK